MAIELYTQGCIQVQPSRYLTKDGLRSDNIVNFDIETSTAWVDKKGKLHEYSPKIRARKPDFYSDKQFVSNCYIWQCSVDERAYYGRRLQDFPKFLTELHSKLKADFIVWVHNLSFEFWWLLDDLKFDDMFFKNSHHPLYLRYKWAEFRCSYNLTRLSLAAWAEEHSLPVKKLTGAVDYSKLRTPLTELTQADLDYSEHDVMVMYHGIKRYRERFGHVHDIPMTQTGIVRRKLKQAVHDDRRYHELCASLQPPNYKMYALMRAAGWGGYVHAMFMNAGRLIVNCKSKDLCSAYPSVICNRKFPMTPFKETTDQERYLRDENFSLLLDITYIGYEITTLNSYVSSSKAYELCEPIVDNGRVVKAEKMSLICTSVDYRIIESMSTWDAVRINHAWVSRNAYLPTVFVDMVLTVYEDKTSLKEVEGMEQRYRASKEELNAIYGMMLTALVNDTILFTGKQFKTVHPDPKEINKLLQDIKDKPYKSFLCYQWGIFVTAYTRELIWEAIRQIDADVVYSDTDSVKYTGNHEEVFETINAKVIERNKAAAEHHGFSMDRFSPKTKKGTPKMLGIFDSEKTADEFKTIGAKRYAARYGDTIKTTLSGVSKSKGAKALRGNVNNLRDDMIFAEDECGRLYMQYVYDQKKITWPDGYVSTNRYAINAVPATYKLGLSADFAALLELTLELSDDFRFMNAQDLHKAIYGG